MEYLDITVNREGYIEFESDKAKIVFSTAETGKNFNRHTEDGVKTLNAIIEEFEVEEVAYIRQVHSSTIHVLSNDDIKDFIEKEGDAIITSKTNTAIGVFTADCVPVIIVDDVKGVVAAIHSGWRGTISSITKKTIEAMNREYNTEYKDVKVYIGPHIRKCCYEVSQELKETFLEETRIPEEVLFDGRRLSLEECILKDIREIGVLEENIYTLNLCTYCNEDIKLHSYRKSNGDYGRLFSFVILK